MDVVVSECEWYPVLELSEPSADPDIQQPLQELPDELVQRYRAAKDEFVAAVAAIYDHQGRTSSWHDGPYRPGWMED